MIPKSLQPPIDSIPRREWDVVVAGAGPAGCAAALHLAAQGVSVLLAEAARFPREKPCGDALVPESIHLLRRLGLETEVRARSQVVPGYTLVSPNGRQAHLAREFLVCRRETFDALLATQAAARGADFVQARFQSAQNLADGRIECLLDQTPVRARILIVATGSELGSLRTLGSPKPRKPEGVAMRRYFRSATGPDRAFFIIHDAFMPGYAWIFPAGDGWYNVGCGRFFEDGPGAAGSLGEGFERFLREDPTARRLVDEATTTTPMRGAPLRCSLRAGSPARRGAALLAGETLGTTIPGWGEGISNALATGLLAAETATEALRANDLSRLDDYPRRLARKIQPAITRHAWTATLFHHRWAANLVVALARLLPGPAAATGK